MAIIIWRLNVTVCIALSSSASCFQYLVQNKYSDEKLLLNILLHFKTRFLTVAVSERNTEKQQHVNVVIHWRKHHLMPMYRSAKSSFSDYCPFLVCHMSPMNIQSTNCSTVLLIAAVLSAKLNNLTRLHCFQLSHLGCHLKINCRQLVEVLSFRTAFSLSTNLLRVNTVENVDTI